MEEIGLKIGEDGCTLTHLLHTDKPENLCFVGRDDDSYTAIVIVLEALGIKHREIEPEKFTSAIVNGEVIVDGKVIGKQG